MLGKVKQRKIRCWCTNSSVGLKTLSQYKSQDTDKANNYMLRILPKLLTFKPVILICWDEIRLVSCAEISPLGWAVGVYVSNEWRTSERFGGKHPSLKLNSKSHDGVTDQGHLSGLCVDHLSSKAHSARGQRHCNKEKEEKATLALKTLPTFGGILG